MTQWNEHMNRFAHSDMQQEAEVTASGESNGKQI